MFNFEKIGEYPGDKEDLRAEVIRYCIERHKPFRVYKSSHKQIQFVCIDRKNCKFNVKAKVHRDGNWYITSGLNITHTCHDAQRTRSVRSADLAVAYPMLSGETASDVVREAAKHGITVSPQQAGHFLRKKRKLNIATYIAAYSFVSEYLVALKNADVDGVYELETAKCTSVGDNNLAMSEQFKRVFVVWGFAKTFAAAFNGVLILDSSLETNGNFPHRVLFALGRDGNNQLISLGFAIVDKLSDENWGWFLSKFLEEFDDGTFRVAMCDSMDGGSACVDVLQKASIRYSRCVRTVADGVRKNVHGHVDRDLLEAVTKVARSYTADSYAEAIDEVRRFSVGAASWLDAHKSEFASYVFLENGVQRYGIVAHDPNERMSAVFAKSCSLDICGLIKSFMDWTATTVDARRESKSAQMMAGNQLTSYAAEELDKLKEQAGEGAVNVFDESDGTVCAEVVSMAGTTRVSIDVVNHKIRCQCKVTEELGMPCRHAMAVILDQKLDVDEFHQWFHTVYWRSSYVTQYSKVLPRPLTNVGCLEARDLKPPSLPENPDSQPSRKRKEQPTTTTTTTTSTDDKKLRMCSSCGNRGHFAARCPAPNVEYILQSEAKEIEKAKKRFKRNDGKQLCIDIVPMDEEDDDDIDGVPV